MCAGLYVHDVLYVSRAYAVQFGCVTLSVSMVPDVYYVLVLSYMLHVLCAD